MESFYGNWIDLILIFAFLAYLFSVINKGFVNEFLELFGFLISLFGSLSLFGLIAPIYIKYFSIPKSFSNALGFFTAWLVIEVIYFFAIRQIVTLIPTKIFQSRLNKLTVFIPAVASFILLASFILTLILSLPTSGRLKTAISKSSIGGQLVKITSRFDKPLERAIGSAIEDSLNFLTIKPESRQVINLEFPKLRLLEDPESETIMFAKVNLERQKQNIPALEFDSNLQKVARSHSQDMFERNYFSHYSPEGKDVGDRLEKTRVEYFIAGENLAYAPNVAIAHQGLMNSSGHKHNILDPKFKRVGIGVIDGEAYGKMFTQVFTD